MIADLINKFIQQEEIVFVVSNFGDDKSNSHDIDIYCVSRGKSAVHLFFTDGRWVELFVDNLEDLDKKIINIDEIAINFIRELKFVLGDKALYQSYLSKTNKIVKNYKLPMTRKNILKYRVKVLLSKYLNPDSGSSQAQEQFIINSLSFPLVQLAMEYHNVFPSSPKRWIAQLQQNIPTKEFRGIRRFLAHEADRKLIVELCEKYAGELKNIDIDKSRNNSTTFIS